MERARIGIIINTENYQACVDFYREIFELPLMFSEVDGDFALTCFDLDGTYLMIETHGVAQASGKSMEQSATKLRINVPDIEAAHAHLRSKGVDCAVERNPWGSTINIHDPDGNRIGIRDEASFEKQIK